MDIFAATAISLRRLKEVEGGASPDPDTDLSEKIMMSGHKFIRMLADQFPVDSPLIATWSKRWKLDNGTPANRSGCLHENVTSVSFRGDVLLLHTRPFRGAPEKPIGRVIKSGYRKS